MSQIFKTTALSDELERFFVAALKGKIHEYCNESQLCPVGSQKTPISFGLSEGYSPQDIVHFYLTRELGVDWQRRLVDNLSEDFRRRVDVAFGEFREDSQLEIDHHSSSLRKEE